MSDLHRRLEELARTPVLLVASDFDGTLAPIVTDPDDAAATTTAMAAFRRLGALAHTHLAVISGRGLEDLSSRVPDMSGMTLAGSHGAEVQGTAPAPLTSDAERSLSLLAAELRSIAEGCAGAHIEEKPRSIAFHFRAARSPDAWQTIHALAGLRERFPSLTMREGSMVIEFVADTVNKGDALRTIRRQVGATGVIFIGDDLTDEDAFNALTMADAGVKVGPGPSTASLTVGGVDEVGSMLARLADARAAWLSERVLEPIQSNALLSDQRTVALVNPTGRLVWLCLPRVDSPALFAELVDGPGAGFFEIAPVDAAAPGEQQYEEDSMILRTSWPECSLVDYLDCAGGRAFQRAGRSDLVRVVKSSVPVRVRFAPRLDFGRAETRLIARDGALEIEGATDPAVLCAPGVAWTLVEDGRHQTAEAVIAPSAEATVFELRYGTGNPRVHPHEESRRRRETHGFWSSWVKSLTIPPVQSALVRRSALVLRALCHGPSGAIAAAATTSLPEHLGGVRNWDYRFCWPRDAALAAAALIRLGNTGTAMRFLDWMLGVVDHCESPDRLRPIYTVSGADLGPEAEISELAGYGGSRPVRIGNAAAQQVQLDVFGPIVDLIASLAERGAPISPDQWRLTRAMVNAVETRWQEADNGIWEIRGPRRHHVHSRVMCFQTIERAQVVHEAVVGRTNEGWSHLREAIREDVLTHGFNEDAGAFTSSYGSIDLDAAVLQIGLTGLIDRSDPRWARTVDAVDRGLRRGPVVDRYRFDDQLPGREGGFHICTGWLIESFLTLGRQREAEALLDDFAALAGPTGGLAEQYDPAYRIALGNYPQAYSHLALINAAVAVGASASAASR